MKILVVGSGGREHAVAWKLAQSPKVDKIFCAPGNGGTAQMEKVENIAYKSNQALVDFAKANEIDMTFVGPEVPLVEGIADLFQQAELRIIGPIKQAAMLEGSKAFAKKFMSKYNIPTAEYLVTSDIHEALKHLEKCTYPVVIKADGLAAGKGVIISETQENAQETINDLMLDGKFDGAGRTVVIEEFLSGTEASILTITDGKTIIPFISARDHKPIGEGNSGLNTGGMGVIAPNPAVTEEIFIEFTEKVMTPTLRGIQREGWDFRGIIFFGLMLTQKGVEVLEYNCRFGDPETQAVLPMLKTDLSELFDACWQQRLSEIELEWDGSHSCCVVAASGGYPESYEKGYEVLGLDQIAGTAFIAGADLANDGKMTTSGGRVLAVTAYGKNPKEAYERAYGDMKKICFQDMYYRKDIGLA